MFEAMILLCSTLLICTGGILAALLILAEQGLFRITIQVAAAPSAPIILKQSAGQVFR